MATLNSVNVHLGPNRFTVGYYEIEGDELRMIGPEWEVLRTHTLRPGDNAKAIAAVLTKDIRAKLRGELVEGFNDPISFRAGWA